MSRSTVSATTRSGSEDPQLSPPRCIGGDAPGRRGVLEAAAQRFVAQGYAATTLRQIAQDSGIKAASIYHHFASKQDLFVAVLDEGMRMMVDSFDAVRASSELGELRLRAYVRAHLSALFEHGPFTAAHVAAFSTAPAGVRARVVPARDGYEALWNELLADLMPAGDRDLHLLRLLLFGAMNSTIEWFDPAGETTLDQLAGLLTDQFLHGATR
ncbi:MAG: TetR/AcrR family transcriptional regulator [Actinomycetota bacterium]